MSSSKEKTPTPWLLRCCSGGTAADEKLSQSRDDAEVPDPAQVKAKGRLQSPLGTQSQGSDLISTQLFTSTQGPMGSRHSSGRHASQDAEAADAVSKLLHTHSSLPADNHGAVVAGQQGQPMEVSDMDHPLAPANHPLLNLPHPAVTRPKRRVTIDGNNVGQVFHASNDFAASSSARSPPPRRVTFDSTPGLAGRNDGHEFAHLHPPGVPLPSAARTPDHTVWSDAGKQLFGNMGGQSGRTQENLKADGEQQPASHTGRVHFSGPADAGSNQQLAGTSHGSSTAAAQRIDPTGAASSAGHAAGQVHFHDVGCSSTAGATLGIKRQNTPFVPGLPAADAADEAEEPAAPDSSRRTSQVHFEVAADADDDAGSVHRSQGSRDSLLNRQNTPFFPLPAGSAASEGAGASAGSSRRTSQVHFDDSVPADGARRSSSGGKVPDAALLARQHTPFVPVQSPVEDEAGVQRPPRRASLVHFDPSTADDAKPHCHIDRQNTPFHPANPDNSSYEPAANPQRASQVHFNDTAAAEGGHRSSVSSHIDRQNTPFCQLPSLRAADSMEPAARGARRTSQVHFDESAAAEDDRKSSASSHIDRQNTPFCQLPSLRAADSMEPAAGGARRTSQVQFDAVCDQVTSQASSSLDRNDSLAGGAAPSSSSSCRTGHVRFDEEAAAGDNSPDSPSALPHPGSSITRRNTPFTLTPLPARNVSCSRDLGANIPAASVHFAAAASSQGDSSFGHINNRVTRQNTPSCPAPPPLPQQADADQDVDPMQPISPSSPHRSSLNHGSSAPARASDSRSSTADCQPGGGHPLALQQGSRSSPLPAAVQQHQQHQHKDQQQHHVQFDASASGSLEDAEEAPALRRSSIDRQDTPFFPLKAVAAPQDSSGSGSDGDCEPATTATLCSCRVFAPAALSVEAQPVAAERAPMSQPNSPGKGPQAAVSPFQSMCEVSFVYDGCSRTPSAVLPAPARSRGLPDRGSEQHKGEKLGRKDTPYVPLVAVGQESEEDVEEPSAGEAGAAVQQQQQQQQQQLFTQRSSAAAQQLGSGASGTSDDHRLLRKNTPHPSQGILKSHIISELNLPTATTAAKARRHSYTIFGGAGSHPAGDNPDAPAVGRRQNRRSTLDIITAGLRQKIAGAEVGSSLKEWAGKLVPWKPFSPRSAHRGEQAAAEQGKAEAGLQTEGSGAAGGVECPRGHAIGGGCAQPNVLESCIDSEFQTSACDDLVSVLSSNTGSRSSSQMPSRLPTGTLTATGAGRLSSSRDGSFSMREVKNALGVIAARRRTPTGRTTGADSSDVPPASGSSYPIAKTPSLGRGQSDAAAHSSSSSAGRRGSAL